MLLKGAVNIAERYHKFTVDSSFTVTTDLSFDVFNVCHVTRFCGPNQRDVSAIQILYKKLYSRVTVFNNFFLCILISVTVYVNPSDSVR